MVGNKNGVVALLKRNHPSLGREYIDELQPHTVTYNTLKYQPLQQVEKKGKKAKLSPQLGEILRPNYI